MSRLTVSVGAPRKAPPSLRPTRLDPLQVDVLAALIATIPASRPGNGGSDGAR